MKGIKRNKRSIAYAFLIGLGVFASLELLKDYGTNAFIIGVLLTSFVLLIEIYLDWYSATKVLHQLDMPQANVYNLRGHMFNHVILPLLLLTSCAGFVYFNTDDLIRIISIFFLVFLNLILFVNIHSYYQDNFNIEENTNYIYDIAKSAIFFLGVNVILHAKTFWHIDMWLASFFICLLSLILGILLIYRMAQVSLFTFIYVISMSFIISIFFMILYSVSFVYLGINMVTFLLFYLGLSLLHHKMERTLTREICMEYLLTLILAFLLFMGIS